MLYVHGFNPIWAGWFFSYIYTSMHHPNADPEQGQDAAKYTYGILLQGVEVVNLSSPKFQDPVITTNTGCLHSVAAQSFYSKSSKNTVSDFPIIPAASLCRWGNEEGRILIRDCCLLTIIRNCLQLIKAASFQKSLLLQQKNYFSETFAPLCKRFCRKPFPVIQKREKGGGGEEKRTE